MSNSALAPAETRKNYRYLWLQEILVEQIVCPTCLGDESVDCQSCSDYGFIRRFEFIVIGPGVELESGDWIFDIGLAVDFDAAKIEAADLAAKMTKDGIEDFAWAVENARRNARNVG